MALIYSFKYTDAKGKKSDRVLLAHTVPATMYGGTDITELDEESRGLFIAAVEAAKDRYMLELDQLHIDFDLKHKYRQFKAESMTDVTTESI
jgi:hypothetical protein